MENQTVDVVVLGAGIAGLTAAYRARQAGYTVRVFEKGNRAGGPIRSERTEGYLLEWGPNTVQPKGELVSLIEDLGLEAKMVLADPRLPRFVRFQGSLHPVPMSPPGLLKTRLLSVRGRLRLFLEPFVPRLRADVDENLLSFARRRLGNEIADRLVAPFVSGIWAGDAEQLSAMSAFPLLHRWERRHGSLLRGAVTELRKPKTNGTPPVPKGLLSFEDGLETLPHALAHALGTDLQLNATADELFPEQQAPGEVRWRLRIGSHSLLARNVFLTIPTFEAAGLVARFAPAAASALDAVPYVPVAVVHLGFRREDLGTKPHGFGFLTLPSEPSDILGCIWSSSLFSGRAPAGCDLLTVIMGGARRRELPALPDGELLHRAFADIRETMNISGRPAFVRVARHPRAIPQYTLGHSRRVLTLAKTEVLFPGIKFAGNYIEGIAVGDVVRQATTAVASDLN